MSAEHLLTANSLISARVSRRFRYVALAAATIALGLWVHRGGAMLGTTARDVAGDAVWAAMMLWWVSAFAPARPLLFRSAVAFAISVAVELSQLIDTPAIDAVRATTLGSLVLGSGFDPRDIAAYALGVATAALLEWAVLHSMRARR